MKILNETKQPLLERIKYEMVLDHNKAKTPTKLELIDKIAPLIKKDKALIVIDKILTKSGTPSSKLLIYAYESQKALENSKPKKNGKKKNKKQKSK